MQVIHESGNYISCSLSRECFQPLLVIGYSPLPDIFTAVDGFRTEFTCTSLPWAPNDRPPFREIYSTSG